MISFPVSSLVKNESLLNHFILRLYFLYNFNMSFTFIGNSPIVFNNIKHIPAMTSEKLAEEFRKFDLFLHPSHMEACSNTLIEAMHCGLVPIAMNNTSHPEIIKYGGLLFDGVKDVLKVIDQASSELQSLKELLNPPKIDEVGSLYIKFAKKISEQESNDLTTPSWGDFCFVWIGWQVMRQKLRLQSLCSKLGESIRNNKLSCAIWRIICSLQSSINKN